MENKNQPLVSIVATSYNFEKFIPYFIESIFHQSYKNWELIVVDDSSVDKSFELLKQYEKRDIRIRVLRSDKNRHTSYATNRGLECASGKYVCLISCDDALLPEKIQNDVVFMEEHDDIGVRYGQLQQIDEWNCIQEYCYLPPEPFDQTTLLRGMYLEGNKCLAPGMFFRSDIMIQVGEFHPLLRMTQDYDYHVRILFQTKPAFNLYPLIQYRRMSDNSNLSSNHNKFTINSEKNETFFILHNYVRYIREYDFLRNIFPEIVEFGPKDNKLIPYYLGRVALTSSQSHVKAFGIKTLFDFMVESENIKYLEQRVGFIPKDLMNIVASCDLYSVSRNSEEDTLTNKNISNLYLKRILALFKNSISEWRRNGVIGIIQRAVRMFGLGKALDALALYWSQVKRFLFPRKARLGKQAKIAYVIPGVKISGGVAIVLNHVNRLQERGYDVRILTFSLDTKIDWFPNRVPVFSILNGKSRYDDVDVMIATHWGTAAWVKRSGAPRQLYFVQSDERRFNPENEEEISAITKTYQMDLEYMTEALWIQRWLREEFGHAAYYVPNGLDLELFYQSESIGEVKKKVRVLLEGPIDSWFKGMREAYAAVSELDCELWIISSRGRPPEGWRYDRFFENVPMSQMKDIYSSCDVFLKMSYMEGFFGPPMESMACGCAVVVGKVTGYDEYIVHGKNALVVPEGDVIAAREAVKQLMDDTVLRERLVKCGYETVKDWSWNDSIDLLEKVIAGLRPERNYDLVQLERYSYEEETKRLADIRKRIGL